MLSSTLLAIALADLPSLTFLEGDESIWTFKLDQSSMRFSCSVPYQVALVELEMPADHRQFLTFVLETPSQESKPNQDNTIDVRLLSSGYTMNRHFWECPYAYRIQTNSRTQLIRIENTNGLLTWNAGFVSEISLTGDVNGDSTVDAEDYIRLGEDLGICPSDVTVDGVIDFTDLLNVCNDWGPCSA